MPVLPKRRHQRPHYDEVKKKRDGYIFEEIIGIMSVHLGNIGNIAQACCPWHYTTKKAAAFQINIAEHLKFATKDHLDTRECYWKNILWTDKTKVEHTILRFGVKRALHTNMKISV